MVGCRNRAEECYEKRGIWVTPSFLVPTLKDGIDLH